MPDIDTLISFVQQRCKVLENVKCDLTVNKIPIKGGMSNRQHKVTLTTTTADVSPKNCLYCNQSHPIYRCFQFKKLTSDKRKEFVTSKRLCFSCLSASHMVTSGPSKATCSICSKQHHTLLHRKQESATSQNPVTGSSEVKTQQTSSSESQAKFSGLSRSTSTVVLGTAIVHVFDRCNVSHPVRVLLDSGSQVSAITSECVSRLNLPRQKCLTQIVGLSQDPVSNVKGKTSITLTPHQSSHPMLLSDEVIILPEITGLMPATNLPAIVRERYQHLLLADPQFDSPSRVEMLIGGDLFPYIIRPNSEIIHAKGFPSAIDTHLGWVLIGTVDQPQRPSSPLTSLTIAKTPSIDTLMQRFWTVEEPTTPSTPTTEEELCEQWFVQNTTRDDTGRFCVALPFRDNIMRESTTLACANLSSEPYPLSHGLGNSKPLALKRLYNLEQRLQKDQILYEAYRQFMDEYLSLGHMKLATQPGKYFIPHHAVVKRDGDVSKLRVVFDASAKSSSGLSLNDVICVGPKLQTDISDMLLTCRLQKYIFIADIVKMYRQILVRKEDCVYQHILWRRSPEHEVQEYELLTVTYGLSAAPYLAIRTLHMLDTFTDLHFPAAKGVLTNQTYVDDILVGANTEKELLRIQEHVIKLLQSAGCSLKKWCINSVEILKCVPSGDRIQCPSFDPKDESSIKVLGLHWDPHTDTFGYHTSISSVNPTKRGVLSTIARLFDPVGALGPTLLWAKSFMQQLWHNRIDWDTKLPPNLLSAWDSFVTEMPHLANIALRRHIDTCDYQDVQLMGFSDASQQGYAATVYLRVVNSLGDIQVYFLTCKTKVAPLKNSEKDMSLTIPRLELCAALLLSRVLHRVRTVLSSIVTISKVRAWTDSTIVLSWLTTEQKCFKIFVTNRIAKIHELMPDCDWSYISTTQNPADPSSRGLLPNALTSCTIHWDGPPFLELAVNQWPQSKFNSICVEDLPDYQPPKRDILLTCDLGENEDILHRFSSLTRMLRTLAYCLRFAHRTRGRPKVKGVLTVTELEHVLSIVVKITQEKHFPKLYKQLKGDTLLISPPSMAQLAPFIDPCDIIRVGGRLRFSTLSEDSKHPILLPKSSHLSTLIIRHYHLSFLHSGPKLILSMIGRKYWILSGRDAVRQFIFSCTRCTRIKALHPKPLMADLPSPRVQPHRPFLHTGMDYGGPFVIKESRRRNAKTSKAYLALFICMSTKAVHLEVVTDLTTQSFLATLDRFVARRGIPSDIYCDNGTNYVGAARQMKILFTESSARDAMTTRVPCEWHFNPPSSPHFGGLWEAAIKSTKNHLKHAIGLQVLTYEELHTLFTRIEGILNSRPLSPLSSDPHDLCALTPGHFLIGQPIQALPERNVTSVPMNRLERWTLLRQCHQTFWTRWAREYLTTLQGRMKWYQASSNLAKGDLVIVEAPNRPPTDWHLGRITDVHPGPDGIVRVVTVRTKDGCFKRPAVKLVKLPA